MRGDDVVEVGVGVDDDAVLAAHLGDDALELALAGARPSRRVSMIFRPTAPLPVKAIVAMRGSLDERRADVALAGQQRDARRAGRRPRAARATSSAAQPGDCSAGLRIAGLPVASAAAVMPSGIASGKFHGAMTAHDAARRRSAARCARRAAGAAAGRAACSSTAWRA